MKMEYYYLRSIGCSAQEDTLFGQHSLFISMKKSWKNNGKVLLPVIFTHANLVECLVLTLEIERIRILE